MNDQASKPGEYLPANVGQTTGASIWRRKAPVLSFCAVLLAGLIALTMQTFRMLDLRRENAALRAATASLDQLRQDNAELARLRAAAQQAEGAQKEQEELEKLRAEVGQLRTIAQELPALRAESQRLAAERAEAAAKAGVVAEVDPFAEAKGRAQRIHCISNIKQIGLAARMWENDRKVGMPADFLSMSNELTSPKILTCDADTSRTKANDWREFDGSSVSYELLSPGADPRDPSIVYVRCPICNNVGMVDGSALQLGPDSRVEKVDGKFKIVRTPANPAQP
ncbi:MAG TPA: hypothetical protein VFT34_03845 [Verrucomicrobiae bacterium]|nr:hypothetical protein [Verrucomicrobiae bacterium]